MEVGKGPMMAMFKNKLLKHQPENLSSRREALKAWRRRKPTEKKGASRHKLYTLEMWVQIPTPQQKTFMNPQSRVPVSPQETLPPPRFRDAL